MEWSHTRGKAKFYPWTWSSDWFCFFSVFLCLATKTFGGSKNYDYHSFYLSPLFLFFLSPPSLGRASCVIYLIPIDLGYPFVDHAGCYLSALSHLPPFSACYELQQTRWYCSGVISSLMRPERQLRVFNAEVTASPRIAHPPCSHSWPTVLVLLFGTPERAVFESVPLSSSVTLVGRGQGCPRRCLPAAWTFLIRPWTFLLLQHGPWAWYEMGRDCQILQPHRYYLGI